MSSGGNVCCKYLNVTELKSWQTQTVLFFNLVGCNLICSTSHITCPFLVAAPRKKGTFNWNREAIGSPLLQNSGLYHSTEAQKLDADEAWLDCHCPCSAAWELIEEMDYKMAVLDCEVCRAPSRNRLLEFLTTNPLV